MEVHVVCGTGVVTYLGLLQCRRERNVINQENLDTKAQIYREAWKVV